MQFRTRNQARRTGRGIEFDKNRYRSFLIFWSLGGLGSEVLSSVATHQGNLYRMERK